MLSVPGLLGRHGGASTVDTITGASSTTARLNTAAPSAESVITALASRHALSSSCSRKRAYTGINDDPNAPPGHQHEDQFRQLLCPEERIQCVTCAERGADNGRAHQPQHAAGEEADQYPPGPHGQFVSSTGHGMGSCMFYLVHGRILSQLRYRTHSGVALPFMPA